MHSHQFASMHIVLNMHFAAENLPREYLLIITKMLQAASAREAAACEKESAAQNGLSAILSWEKRKGEEESRLEALMLEAQTQKSLAQEMLESVEKKKEATSAAKK